MSVCGNYCIVRPAKLLKGSRESVSLPSLVMPGTAQKKGTDSFRDATEQFDGTHFTVSLQGRSLVSNFADVCIPPFARYYTDETVKEGETCDARVSAERQRIRAGEAVTLGVVPTVSLGMAMLIFALVGIFAVGIAQAFQLVRRYVYHDADNLDTAFDAGGKVSIGLTATTIVSQWTWSATLLQSSTVASKYGISGPYWYAGGATIQIILFSILSIMLKTRAPGAKTFLQVSSPLSARLRLSARTPQSAAFAEANDVNEERCQTLKKCLWASTTLPRVRVASAPHYRISLKLHPHSHTIPQNPNKISADNPSFFVFMTIYHVSMAMW